MNRAVDAGGQAHVRRLLKNTLAFGAAGFAAQGAFVLAEVVIARSLGHVAYGIFTSAFVLSRGSEMSQRPWRCCGPWPKSGCVRLGTSCWI